MPEKNCNTVAVILAGGVGERFNTEVPKQFLKLSGKMIIEHTIDLFERHHLIDELILVVNEHYFQLMNEIYLGKRSNKVRKILIGGKTRQESSKIGVFACDPNAQKVLIHDAVRPFVSEEIITNVIQSLDNWTAIDVAIPTADTIIKISDEHVIQNIPIRKYLLRGQTPQGFQLSAIKNAHMMAEAESFNDAVDDCSLILKYKLADVFVVNGSEYNIKITYPLDLDIADKIFQINSIKLPAIDVLTIKERLKGKVAVVFGNSSGIGLEVHKLCHEYGCLTYGFSRTSGVDIRNYEEINEQLEKIYNADKQIDYVICTSGILKTGSLEELSISNITDQINTNLVGNMLVAKASIPYMKKTRGSLLFFASSSYTRGRRNYIPYSASKAGLVNFAQGLAEELSDYGVKVNVLNPERTNTALRWKNFGIEDKTTLLSPKYVALCAIRTIVTNITGSVIDVRKLQEINI